MNTDSRANGMKEHSNQDTREPIFSFGIIADVQHADIENGQNFHRTRTRYYRSALGHLDKAICHWNRQENISFVLQLGDLIDGQNRRGGHQTSVKAMELALEHLNTFNGPTYSVVGNHELYNFKRKELIPHPIFSNVKKELENCICYQFAPVPGFRFVCLDQYSCALLGYDKTDEMYKKAERYLRITNKNEDLNSPTGLHGAEKRFCKWNGSMTEDHLSWLEDVLQESDARQERVIVYGHLPVYEPSCDLSCLCWNYEKVLQTLQRHACVVAYFCGHDHDGGAAIDERGIQHITFQGVIETSPEVDCYATAHVYLDRIEVQGHGRIPTYNIGFRNKTETNL